MRVACSLILSSSLLCPGALLPWAQTTQDNNAKQAAQEPQPVAPVVKQPLAFGLEDATPVRLRITRTISSADAQVNDTVDFEVLEEVKVHDVIVIPRGGTAWGTVTEAQPKRRMGRGGKLDINIDNVRLTSGEKVALRAVKDVKGGGHQGAMTGAIVATSIVFFPAAPLFLLVHGKDITIPKGTEITAYTNGDIPLDPRKFSTQTAISPESGAATVQPAAEPQSAPIQSDAAPSPVRPAEVAATGTVEVHSTPEGAEVYVDGAFIGNAPATLKLSPGQHTIRVTQSGFKDWSRDISVQAGSGAHLSASLDKQD
jgi:hypothetical protein